MSDPTLREEMLRNLQQLEKLSLEQLYAPEQKIKGSPISKSQDAQVMKNIERLRQRRAACLSEQSPTMALLNQEVEQERELAVELETVREIQKPPPATAIKPETLDSDVLWFAISGKFKSNSKAYKPVRKLLADSATGSRYGFDDNPQAATAFGLHTTRDYAQTVSLKRREKRDEFCRPVHWISWSSCADNALILSENEADALLPFYVDLDRNRTVIGKSNRAPLQLATHLVCYSTPVTKSMLHFDNLNFFTIPPAPSRICPRLIRDLGLFAGRLSFDPSSQLRPICEALGLDHASVTLEHNDSESQQLKNVKQGEDEEEEEEEYPGQMMCKDPLGFMNEWLAIRQRGHDVSETMMGKLCYNRP